MKTALKGSARRLHRQSAKDGHTYNRQMEMQMGISGVKRRVYLLETITNHYWGEVTTHFTLEFRFIPQITAPVMIIPTTRPLKKSNQSVLELTNNKRFRSEEHTSE